jgi:hypothetical protein
MQGVVDQFSPFHPLFNKLFCHHIFQFQHSTLEISFGSDSINAPINKFPYNPLDYMFYVILKLKILMKASHSIENKKQNHTSCCGHWLESMLKKGAQITWRLRENNMSWN